MGSVEKIKSRKLKKDIFNHNSLEKSEGDIYQSHRLKNAKIRVKNTCDSDGQSKENFFEKAKKIHTRKLHLGQDVAEKKLDKEIQNEDNLSISLMVLILIGCFVIGIILGYMLYRLAIDSSAIIIIGRNLLP